MTKQERWTRVVERLIEEKHPFSNWISPLLNEIEGVITLDWVFEKQWLFKEALESSEEMLTVENFTAKEVLQSLKSLWDFVRRLYFRDYFLSELLSNLNHPLYELFQDLSKGISSHDVYLAIENRWASEVGPYCLSLGDDFSNLARLALSKFYTAQKNNYYDNVLSLEVKNFPQNPFYSFVHLVEENVHFDEALYQTFEQEVTRVEDLIFSQNEQYQRKLFALLKPYFIRGKQAYYKTLVGTSSWDIAVLDIRRHPNWLRTNQLLVELDLEKLKTRAEFDSLVEQVAQSELAREREMGYFEYHWIQNEFEKRLRFLEKKITLSSENQFAPWLKQMREAHGLSYRQLEQLSGVSSTYLHRLEMGARKSPSIPIAKKIAQAFGVSFDAVAKFVDSETIAEGLTTEAELDLLKLLEVKPLMIGKHSLTKKKRQSLAQLLELVMDKTFNPQHLPDTMEALELIKAIRKN